VAGDYGSTIVIAPDMRGLSERHRAAAVAIARRLAGAGFRAWLVGGAVRDLARGVTPKDVDMVSAARPAEVEALFERTIAVGRAFGIVVVLIDGLEVELATFRTEGDYSDRRRPDEVHLVSSVEEDAARRDFTVNALYLDPLTGEVADPCGGLDDLRAGALRAVGDAERRFAEDGLRLLRMARLASALDLVTAPGLLEAARASVAALEGVSPERVREELARIFAGPRSAAALELLDGVGLLELALPGWEAREVLGWGARRVAWDALPDPPGEPLGWALLLEGDPLGSGEAPVREADLARLDRLRPSRALRGAVEFLWRWRRPLVELAQAGESRAARIRILRQPGWEDALALARAWVSAAGGDPAPLEALAAWRRELPEEDLRPQALVTSADLRAAGIAPGPRMGELLREAEDLQLEGRMTTPAQADAWLAGLS